MSHTLIEVANAMSLIRKCESDLRQQLTVGEATDLLADNNNEWSVDKCHAVAHEAISNIYREES